MAYQGGNDGSFAAPVSRRLLLGGLATAGALAGTARVSAKAGSTGGWDVIVVGAGVFGAWTAWNLQRHGQKVLLLDAWGAGHARSSSDRKSTRLNSSH